MRQGRGLIREHPHRITRVSCCRRGGQASSGPSRGQAQTVLVRRARRLAPRVAARHGRAVPRWLGHRAAPPSWPRPRPTTPCDAGCASGPTHRLVWAEQHPPPRAGRLSGTRRTTTLASAGIRASSSRYSARTCGRESWWVMPDGARRGRCARRGAAEPAGPVVWGDARSGRARAPSPVCAFESLRPKAPVEPLSLTPTITFLRSAALIDAAPASSSCRAKSCSDLNLKLTLIGRASQRAALLAHSPESAAQRPRGKRARSSLP